MGFIRNPKLLSSNEFLTASRDDGRLKAIVIDFVKAHACGNDFLLLEETAANRNHAALARKLCARNTSVGADGIEFLNRNPDPSYDADVFLRLFNADGSEAELSGNGTRCVAAWLAHSEGRDRVTFGTHGGPRACTVLESNGPEYRIETGMGVPRVMPRTLELSGVGLVHGAMVNVGNPHFVLFVEDENDTEDFSAHGLPWQQLGEMIATSPMFPHGINVEFVRVLSRHEIAFRIYERGCGPTRSSGTGTCAASAAAMALRDTARELTAIAEGGAQTTVWLAAAEPMRLTGSAEIVCIGKAFV